MITESSSGGHDCEEAAGAYWQDEEARSVRGSAAVLGAQSTGGRGIATKPPSPLTRLLKTITAAVDHDQALRDVRTIWETDRWFTFP
jgi:hypothetical protein